MKIVDISRGIPTDLGQSDTYWVYNGLDCCATAAVLDSLKPKILGDNSRGAIYALEQNLQAPVLEMNLRGFLIDPALRNKWIFEHQAKALKLQNILDQFTRAFWHQDLNVNSPKQMKAFFYGFMSMPAKTKRNKETGKMELTCDRDALESWLPYHDAKPFIKLILALRGVLKALSTMTSEIDPDGRFRTSFNIAGTNTGRFSSSSNAFGSGSNIQNITQALRQMFIADKGKKIAYIDLEQAESKLVAYCSGDQAYIDACESGDPHTIVTRMVWPDMEWTGDSSLDRAIADDHDNLFYRHFTYRDMAKRGGHLTNYFGPPYTMSKGLKIPIQLAERFQESYFNAFPGISDWQSWCAERIQTENSLVTPYGRVIQFFGRVRDDSVIRRAISSVPQSSVGDYLNTGMLNTWRMVPEVQLLVQLHDAVCIQYDDISDEHEAHCINSVVKQLTQTIEVTDINGTTRPMSILTDTVTGWNWSYASKTNPDGLKKWRGTDDRKRTTNT